MNVVKKLMFGIICVTLTSVSFAAPVLHCTEQTVSVTFSPGDVSSRCGVILCWGDEVGGGTVDSWAEDLPGRFSIWDNFFVFKDTNPSCPPDERYKGIGFDTKMLDEDVKSSFREALSYYETGKRDPNLSMLIAMSKYFNVSIHYLITGEEFDGSKQ